MLPLFVLLAVLLGTAAHPIVDTRPTVSTVNLPDIIQRSPCRGNMKQQTADYERCRILVDKRIRSWQISNQDTSNLHPFVNELPAASGEQDNETNSSVDGDPTATRITQEASSEPAKFTHESEERFSRVELRSNTEVQSVVPEMKRRGIPIGDFEIETPLEYIWDLWGHTPEEIEGLEYPPLPKPDSKGLFPPKEPGEGPIGPELQDRPPMSESEWNELPFEDDVLSDTTSEITSEVGIDYGSEVGIDLGTELGVDAGAEVGTEAGAEAVGLAAEGAADVGALGTAGMIGALGPIASGIGAIAAFGGIAVAGVELADMLKDKGKDLPEETGGLYLAALKAKGIEMGYSVEEMYPEGCDGWDAYVSKFKMGQGSEFTYCPY